MRFFILFLLSISALFLSCINSSQGTVEPFGYTGENPVCDPEDECHRYLVMLGQAQFRYYGKYNEYAMNPEDLQEFLSVPAESICCPVNGEYIFLIDTDGYRIECPSVAGISHGYIVDGFTSWPPDPSEHEAICYNNLLCMGSVCAMYYGKYNCYPDSLEDFEEFISIEFLLCPLNGDYIISSDTAGYVIECPSNSGMSHGFIRNGIISWHPDHDPSQYPIICHNNMMGLASACAVFYGQMNRYPERLSELGLEGVMENWDLECPACGFLYDYEADPPGQTYLLRCPLGGVANHGSVVDGIVSWE